MYLQNIVCVAPVLHSQMVRTNIVTNIDTHTNKQTNTQGENIITSLTRVINITKITTFRTKLYEIGHIWPKSCYVVWKKWSSWVKMTKIHDDVIKWKHFPRYWPFVQGILQWPVNSPHKRPVTQSFDVFFDLRLNKRLSKQSRGWWFEMPSHTLWRHCNVCWKYTLWHLSQN